MKRIILSLTVAAALTVGCSEDKPAEPVKAAEPAKAMDKPAEPTPPPAAADPVAEAKTIFQTRCTVCHGASGKGDGATAATLNPKPRDYTDKAWQAQITDEQLAKTIVEGGAAMGKSPLMPGNPDLAAKPEVVAEVVKLIRAFGAAAGGDAPAEGAAAPAAGDKPADG